MTAHAPQTPGPQPPAPPAWSEVRREFERLLDIDSGARAAALEELRAANPDLARRVHELLTSSKLAGLNAESGEALAALASEITPAAPAPGQTVGRFTLVRMIGAGGMGAVFEATDAELGRQVALKFVWGGPRTGSAFRRFQAEARTLARLRHPGIAQVYDVGSWEQPRPGPVPGSERIPFIAMEFVPGASTIADHARTLDDRRRIALFADVLDAVHEAHQRGVIHRDLKPANILVDESGRPKVIDFGIARILDAAAPEAAASTTANASGTLRYMSPESLAAGPGAAGPDVRSDLYALGVVLYELLEEAAPFRHADTRSHQGGSGPAAAGVANLVQEIRAGSWRTPRLTLVNDAAARADLRAVIARAMALAPADRYESVAAFAADLRRVLAREPVVARPASLWREARSLARRHRPMALAAAVAALALAVGAAAAWSGLVRARQALAQKQAESVRLQRTIDFFRGVMLAANPSLPKQGHDTPLSEWIQGPRLGPSLQRRGASATLVDVLLGAADLLDTQFADDPELRARIQLQVASDLQGVYQTRRSLELFSRAHATLRDVLGPDHPDTLRAQLALASAIGVDLQQCIDLFRDALPSLERLFSAHDPRVEGAVLTLADRLAQTGRLDEALKAVDRFALVVRANAGPDSERAWSLEAFRSRLALGAPDPPARAPAMERLVEAHRNLVRLVGDDAVSTIIAATSLATAPGIDPDQSLALLVRALDSTTRVYGSSTNAAHELRTMLARAFMYRRDLPAAETVLREQLRAAREIFGESGYATCKTKGFLARVLTWVGKDLEEAQQLAHEAANDALAHVNTGRQGDWEAWFYAVEAKAIRLRGDPARAEAMLRELTALRGGKNLGAWCDAYILTQLAEALLDQARPAEARDALDLAERAVKLMNDPEAPIAWNWRETLERLEKPANIPAPR